MVKPGVEAIIGVTRDAHFGPVLMFGLGGIFTELLEDICFRLIPIGEEDDREMVASTRAARLLAGYRGQPARDDRAVGAMLCRVSELVWAPRRSPNWT